MDKPVRIPVKINPRAAEPEIREPGRPVVSEAPAPVTGFEGVQAQPASDGGRQGDGAGPAAVEDRRAFDRPAWNEEPAAVATEQPARQPAPADGQDWRDRALRLQAEMDNFRKRQQRVAQDEIQAERQRLLRNFLTIVDDLERALAAPSPDGAGLRQGVDLTHRAALQLLEREGVEKIAARGEAFDPNWHEAVTTVDHRQAGVQPNEIVDVLAPGYRYRDQLLRPARVVVAV